VLGDHAGQLVRDGDRWLVLTSSWGDFTPGSIHVRHTTTTDDQDLPSDEGAVEESGTRELGGAGVAGGAGEGTPGGPDGAPFAPGEGPTADEATGITGDPDEG